MSHAQRAVPKMGAGAARSLSESGVMRRLFEPPASQDCAGACGSARRATG